MYIHAYTQTFSEIKERQNRETQGKRDRKEHREDTHTERERERWMGEATGNSEMLRDFQRGGKKWHLF